MNSHCDLRLLCEHCISTCGRIEIILITFGVTASQPRCAPNLGNLDPKGPQHPRTEWVSLTWAGVEKVIPAMQRAVPPPWRLTRFAGFFGPAMAEYVVGTIIARERGLGHYAEAQVKREWEKRGKYRMLQVGMPCAKLSLRHQCESCRQSDHFVIVKMVETHRTPTMYFRACACVNGGGAGAVDRGAGSRRDRTNYRDHLRADGHASVWTRPDHPG